MEQVYRVSADAALALGMNELDPTVRLFCVEPHRRLRFEAGQFLSLYVPDPEGGRARRRAYSFACAPGLGHELCVKIGPGGAGSSYLSGLRPGERPRRQLLANPAGDLLHAAGPCAARSLGV